MGFNKKVLSKAVSELGKAKAPGKPKDITVDPRGYWNPANQGEPVRVPGGDDINGMEITMHQVSQPIWAQPNVGPGAIMYPEENRHFPGASYVDETPIAKKGGTAGKLSSGNKTVTKVVNIKFDLPDLSGAKKIDDKVTLAMSPDSSGVFTIGKDVEKFSGIKESEVKADIAAGKESPEDALIYGLTNVMNGGKDVYLWINGSRLQGMAKKNGADEAITEVVSHEAIHLARHLITRAIAKKKGLNLNNEDWIKHDYGAGEYNWPAVGDENKENPIVQIDEESFATAEGLIVEQILPYFKEMAKSYLKSTDSKEFKKGGTLQSKKYSKSMSATNKLMAKNKLFQNKKSKIFDPNAEFQQGGIKTNPWLYTYDLGMPNSEVVGGGFDTQFKSGIHGSLSGEIPLFNRNSQPWLSQNVGIGRGYKGLYGDVTLNNSSSAGSLLNPSLTTSLQYNKNLGDHYNFRAGLSNLSSKGSYFNPEINAGITYSFKKGGSKLGPINLNPNPLSHYELNYGFNLPVKQDGGESDYEELELTDEEIQAYRDGGYVVEEIPEQEIGGYVQHELVKAQTGLEQNDSDVYTYAGRPDSYYKKDDKGQWLISNKGTGNKFIPIKDPKGDRAKILNAEAKKNVPMTDSPYALAASNFANDNGTDSKQAYIDKYQKSPELAKQKVVKQFKTDKELAKTAEFINSGKLENSTNTDQQLDPRLMGPVGDNTRTTAGFNGQQAFEGALRYNSPESVEERKIQAEWEKQKWDEYAKKSLYDRVLDRTQAFAANPFVLTGNVLSGKQGFIPGMGRGLLNKDNPEEYDRYLQATGQVKGEVSLSDMLNFANPTHWGASAGNEFSKGNYGQGATELGLSLLGVGAGRGLLQGSKALAQSLGRGAKYVGKAMNTAPKFLPGATLNNAINAGFAGHGLNEIVSGDVAEPWKKAMKSGKGIDYATALGENAMTALELAPLVGPAAKGLIGGLNASKESIIGAKNILGDYRNIEQLRLANHYKDFNTASKAHPTIFNDKKVFDATKTEAKQLLKKYKKDFTENFGAGKDDEVLLYGAHNDLKNAVKNKNFLAEDEFAKSAGLKNDLTNQEKFLADAYQLEYSPYFNRNIRNGNQKFSEYLADDFNSLMNKNKTARPVQVSRVSDFDRKVKTLRKGTSEPEMVHYNDLKEGDVIYPEHNWSTTTDLENNVWGSGNPSAKTARINIPENQGVFRPNMYKGTQYANEQELVLPSGLGYKVSGVNPQGFTHENPRFMFDAVTPSAGTSGTLNAGISPDLIKNAVGPRNSVLARIVDNAYFSPPLNKTMDRLSPLNLIPGYGSKLTGATMPLGNVINRSIKNGNLVEAPSLLKQAKNLVKTTEAKPLTTQFNNLNSDIYAAKVSGLNPGSTIGVGQPYKQGFLGRTFAKSKAQYPVQNRVGESLSQIPLSDPGVSLHRRLPFSKRYVPIDKEKLMNNKFQWSTTGSGLQNLGEKFVKSAPVYGALGAGAAALMYNPYDYMSEDAARMVKEENIPLETLTDLPTRTDATKQGFKDMQQSPLEFIKNPDPYGVKFYGSMLGYSQGGNVITEEWEDELDDYTINLLRKAGYVVEEID